MKTIWDSVLELLDSYTFLGERQLNNGTRLVCPTPDIAPMAWLHILFPPLDAEQIRWLKTELGFMFPEDYEEFLLNSNGVFLYAYYTTIWGIRRDYTRVGDDSWQPFDALLHNGKFEVPRGTPDGLFYFGTTKFSEKWCFFDMNYNNPKVGTTDRHRFGAESYFDSFSDWLLVELKVGESQNVHRK